MKKFFVSILLTFFTLLSFPIAHSEVRVQELSTSKYKPHVFTLVYDGDIADKYEKEKKLLKKNNKKLCNFRVTIRSVDEKLLTKPLIDKDIGCQKDFNIEYVNNLPVLYVGDIADATIKFKLKSLTDDKAIFDLFSDSFIISKYLRPAGERDWNPGYNLPRGNKARSLIFSYIGVSIVQNLIKEDKNPNSIRNTRITITYTE